MLVDVCVGKYAVVWLIRLVPGKVVRLNAG